MTPGASSGTRNAETGGPPGVRRRPVAANRITYLENGVPELVMNCLAPLMTQSAAVAPRGGGDVAGVGAAGLRGDGALLVEERGERRMKAFAR